MCGSLPFDDKETSKLYHKIINGEFKIPKFLTEPAKDILKKILNTDPE
jgi:5'-AMP-activated protein kinase catalytic alpha subunit